MKKKKYDLEDRLVNFADSIICLVNELPSDRAGTYTANQLIRCGLAPAFHYGEAQSAESRKDFIHKMNVALKELKETRICLKLIRKQQMTKSISQLETVFRENEELIAIFSKSISTARKNQG